MSTLSTSLYRLLIATIALCFALSAIAANPTNNNDNSIKANYLYQIIKFIDWPNLGHPTSAIQFCLLDHDTNAELNIELEKIHLLVANERKLLLKYVNNNSLINQCNVLFLQGSSAQDYIADHYIEMSENHILTLGENSLFTQQGGIIALHLHKQKPQIEINLQAASDADIKISADLIEIATKIYAVETSNH